MTRTLGTPITFHTDGEHRGTEGENIQGSEVERYVLIHTTVLIPIIGQRCATSTFLLVVSIASRAGDTSRGGERLGRIVFIVFILFFYVLT